MERAGGAAGRLHVVGVLHGPNDGRHHLRRAHDGVARRLLLGQLVDHHGRFVHHDLGTPGERPGSTSLSGRPRAFIKETTIS